MACGGCKKGGGNRHSSNNKGDLKRYAFLSPRQLRRLKSLEQEEKDSSEENKVGEGQE
jgi:hypothetical protein